MANKGTIKEYIVPGSGVYYYEYDAAEATDAVATIAFDWEVTSQDVVNCTTTIDWTYTLTVHNNNNGEFEYIKANDYGSIYEGNIPGKASYYKETIYPQPSSPDPYTKVYPGQTFTIGSGTYTFAHTEEGTRTVDLIINGGINGGYKDVDGTENKVFYVYNSNFQINTSIALEPIYVHAIITSAPNFTDEDSPTITCAIPAKNVSDVQVCISFTGGNDDIPYRSIPISTTSYTFEFTTADKVTLWNLLDQGLTSTPVRFYIKSTFNGEPYYEYKPATLTIKEYEPVLSPTVVDSNPVTKALTGNPNILVRYASIASFNSYAVPRKGASINTQYVKNGEVLKYENDGDIAGPTSNTFYFSVTDNRGYTTKDAVVFSIENGYFVEYVRPTVSAVVGDMTATGEVDVTISGKYYDGSFGATENTLTVGYTLSENNGEATSHTLGAITPTMSGNDYTYTFTIPGLNYLSVYEVSINVADKILTEGTITNVVLASTPVFDWSRTDFNFNVPVNLGDGFTYPQRMIWSGASQLGADDVITLEGDDVISKQPSGIVLVFSLYEDGAAKNASIHSFFISKVEANTLLSNIPHTFMLGINSNLSVFGSKYVYISNTQIKGFSGNTASGTAKCGIIFDNTKFVLRYILGV